ncbi:MAG: protein kinase [Planctomycetota bacterium]|nr:hypothetical protein [Planctomycetota bacterium]MEE3055107.1 protein kinase [Planctomycetota bacterium]
MARVLWRKADGSIEEFSFSSRVVLGRDDEADFKVESKGISRCHILIEERGENYVLSDMGSTNGTLLNGRPLLDEAQLRSGDRICIGTEVIEFFAGEGAAETRGSVSTEPLSRTLAREGSPVARGYDISSLPEVLPRTVGRFELEEKLGQGGMGAVYRARDLESGDEVAVKFIRQNIGRREAFLEYFHHREAVLAREINHPNVIRIYEHGVEEEQHFISMENIRGQSLYQVLKRGRMEPGEVLEILRQVACGLSAAHLQGVVHSDIKPANILLEGETAPVEGAGEGEPGEGDGILEFETEEELPVKAAGEPKSSDPGLWREIEKRVGRQEVPPEAILDDPPYFSRPSEERFLEHYLDRMKAEHGFFILVEGEAGTGKGRLISEFLLRQKRVAASAGEPAGGMRFLELDCSRIEGLPLLYEQFNPKISASRATLREMVEELKGWFDEGGQPTILRVLDMGKASPLACQLLAYLAAKMEDLPLTIIASIEPEEMRKNDSVKTLLPSIEKVLKQLYLRPLTGYQIQRYLQALFRGYLQGNDLSKDLYRLSEGNIARMLDLLRSFFERGILTVNSGSKTVSYRPDFRELELEEGKNLYEKYRQAGRVERHVLEYAAFIGSSFFFDTLARLHDLDETSLYFVVRQLLADGFFTEESRTWYRFTNVAFQRYMAERISLPDRGQLHRKLSRLLQDVPVPESPGLYQLRATHYCGCREYSKAVQCYLEGAHLARNVYKADLAREMYQEILRIYRELARREIPRREVTGVLKSWFGRDGNWYKILGDLGAIESRANVKIADFGISFRTADEERGYPVGQRPALGTPRYLAPERGDGQRGGPRSDIFSLGLIAYEMVCGEAVFPALKGKALVDAYRKKKVRLPPDELGRFPGGFAELVEGMLQINPERRWDAEQVIREVVKLQFEYRMGEQGGK